MNNEKAMNEEQTVNIPPVSPNAVSELLKRCGRLSDPAKILSLWLATSTMIFFLFLGGILLPMLVSMWQESAVVGAIFSGILFAAIVPLPLAMWLVLRPVSAKQVFYLRAFRSDDQASKLRGLLRTALGKNFRLCGIRPPKERINWLSRLFLTTATGFRYIGSNYFEFEADTHNWMARLLASYSKASFVFVDVRDITEHVGAEIRLSYQFMGAGKCIFIVDTSRSEEEWRQALHAILGDLTSPAPLVQLCYPGDAAVEENHFLGEVQRLIKGMPAGLPDSGPAVAFAQTHVSAQDWATPVWEKDWGQFALGILCQVVAAFLLMLLLKQLFGLPAFYADLAPSALITAVVTFFFFRALAAAWREACFQARFCRLLGRANPRWRAAFSIALTGVWVLEIVVGIASIPVFNQVQRKSLLAKAQVQMRAIYFSILTYSMDHDGGMPTQENFLEILKEMGENSPPRQIVDGNGRPRIASGMEQVSLDPWQQPFRYEPLDPSGSGKFVLRSYGPDRLPNTADDLLINQEGEFVRSESEMGKSKPQESVPAEGSSKREKGPSELLLDSATPIR